MKNTTTASEVARMKKLAAEGYTLMQIVKGMRISEKCVRANLKGVAVRTKPEEDFDVEVIGGASGNESTPAPAAAVADIANPAPVGEEVDTRSPQQKAADTRKAKAAAKAEAETSDPSFME